MKSNQPYGVWLLENEIDLKDMWQSMGSVERFEEGGSFEAFCDQQYKNNQSQTPDDE